MTKDVFILNKAGEELQENSLSSNFNLIIQNHVNLQQELTKLNKVFSLHVQRILVNNIKVCF